MRSYNAFRSMFSEMVAAVKLQMFYAFSNLHLFYLFFTCLYMLAWIIEHSGTVFLKIIQVAFVPF